MDFLCVHGAITLGRRIGSSSRTRQGKAISRPDRPTAFNQSCRPIFYPLPPARPSSEWMDVASIRRSVAIFGQKNRLVSRRRSLIILALKRRFSSKAARHLIAIFVPFAANDMQDHVSSSFLSHLKSSRSVFRPLGWERCKITFCTSNFFFQACVLYCARVTAFTVAASVIASPAGRASSATCLRASARSSTVTDMAIAGRASVSATTDGRGKTATKVSMKERWR